MRLWRAVAARLRSLVLRRRSEDDLDEELRLHLEREIERTIAAGVAPDDARRRVLRDFGGVEQIKEGCRDARGTATLDALLAVGATRGQLVRHLLTESVLLSAAGGVAGCILAWWAIRSLSAFDLPIIVDVSLDYRVLTFAVSLSLVTGVAFGLAPALKVTKIDLLPTLRDDGEARSPDHRWLTLKNALVYPADGCSARQLV